MGAYFFALLEREEGTPEETATVVMVSKALTGVVVEPGAWE